MLIFILFLLCIFATKFDNGYLLELQNLVFFFFFFFKVFFHFFILFYFLCSKLQHEIHEIKIYLKKKKKKDSEILLLKTFRLFLLFIS